MWVSPTNSPVRLEFLPLLQYSQVFSVRGLRLYFPMLEIWVAQSISLPSCFSWFICTQMWNQLLHQLPPCPVHLPLPFSESSRPGCLAPALLPVWMNVSSLTPYLSVSIQFDFLSVLVVFCFKVVVVLLLLVRGGTVCPPKPPSWLEV